MNIKIESDKDRVSVHIEGSEWLHLDKTDRGWKVVISTALPVDASDALQILHAYEAAFNLALPLN